MENLLARGRIGMRRRCGGMNQEIPRNATKYDVTIGIKVLRDSCELSAEVCPPKSKVRRARFCLSFYSCRGFFTATFRFACIRSRARVNER